MHIRSAHNKTARDITVVAHKHSCLHQQNITTCNCEKIEVVTEHMYLGLIIDHRFNWGPHINYVCDKLRAILSKMSILRYKLPYKTLRMLYLALPDSVIGYALSTYGKTYKTYIEKIYNLQIRLLKTLVPKHIKKKYETEYAQLFKYCNVLPVQNKCKLAILTEEYHYVTKLKVNKRCTKLRSLQRQNKYCKPKYNNIYGTRLYTYILPKILNDLPEDVRVKYLNGKHIKKVIKMHLLTSDDTSYLY